MFKNVPPHREKNHNIHIHKAQLYNKPVGTFRLFMCKQPICMFLDLMLGSSLGTDTLC